MIVKHNWVGWTLVALLVASVLAIFGLLIAENSQLKFRVDRAEDAVEELVVQNRGPQGPEGDPGRPPTAEEVAAAVADYCAEHDSCRGPQGEPGVAGRSIQGPSGANGQNGTGITKVECLGTSIRFWAGSTIVGNVKMVCIP